MHCAALADDWALAGRSPCGSTATAPARSSRAFPGARIVHLSTSSVYDASSPSVDIREDAATERPVPERLLRVEGARRGRGWRGTDAVILRPHAVYGPGDTTLLPRILDGRAPRSARAARGAERAAQPDPHRQSRARGAPRARPGLAARDLQHRRRHAGAAFGGAARSSSSDEASPPASSSCPTPRPSPSRGTLERSRGSPHARPRLTRYAVSPARPRAHPRSHRGPHPPRLPADPDDAGGRRELVMRSPAP